MICEWCEKPLAGRQKRWCSVRCSWAGHSAERRTAINQRARAGTDGATTNRITDAKLAEVKERYPSCARDWDLAMVDKAWPRLAPLLARRLERLQ